MDMLDKRTIDIINRLKNAKLSLLIKQPFYALLLFQMKFSLDTTCENAYTDGTRIAFNPDFLDKISDKELEFVLMHEVLHAALGHPFRKQSDYDLECYDKACDIIVNANILYSFDMDKKSITLKNFGVAAHKTPSGKFGYDCTVEEVYDELFALYGKQKKNEDINTKISPANNKAEDSTNAITSKCTKYETDSYEEIKENNSPLNNDNDESNSSSNEGNDESNSSSNEGNDESESSSNENNNKDESSSNEANTKNESSSDDNSNENKSSSNEYNDESKDLSNKNNQNASLPMANAAATSSSASKKAAKGLLHNIKNGDNIADVQYDLKGLMDQLKSKNQQLKEKYSAELQATKKDFIEKPFEILDDHSFWQGDDSFNSMRLKWESHVMECANITMEKEEHHRGYGGLPLCAMRMVKQLTQPEVDWRTVLNDFIQEEINDYSFSPPDKRMDDCPFFLPDFNVKEESIKNVWFLIDTSGSIGDKEIEAAYSEIVSAIDMFDGKLEGLLSFTEVFVTEPIPFCSIEELLEIKPVGGGGNDFSEIFRYMNEHMTDNLPTSIVILTDGYDAYPPESSALGVPVFWLLNNQDAPPPPWGRYARFEVNA